MLMLAKTAPGMFGGGGGGPVSTVNAVRFDGTNDSVSRSGTLATSGSLTQGLISFWISPENSSTFTVVQRDGGFLTCQKGTSNQLFIGIYSSDYANQLRIATPSNSIPPGQWTHVIATWDLNAQTGVVYINGTSQTITYSNSGGAVTPGYTAGASWDVGTLSLGSGKQPGSLAELWLALDQTLDITNSTNRQKFRSAAGLPVALGSTGQTPTGTSPQLYLKSPAATYGTNSGTGGDFVITGALEDVAGPI